MGDAAPASQLALRFGPSGWRVVDESDPVSEWIAFATEDREAVLQTLEASLDALKARLTQGGGEQGAAASSLWEDPARALRVAVAALRALRPSHP